jgi:Asp-tRNA(Asn)/Glu-tRNA(Gln) amidotransferase A subunit family amidase
MIPMFENGNPFRKIRNRTKLVIACTLAFGLTLATILPVLNIPLSPFGTLQMALAQAGSDKVKEDNKGKKSKFSVVEASIVDIHNAIKTKQATCTDIVQAYIDRAKAYVGICTQLVTEDGAPISPAFGRVIAGSPLEYPTETVKASDVLPNLDQYVGLPLDLGRMEGTASDPSIQQQFGMVVGIPDAGKLNAINTLNIRGERSITCLGAFDLHPSTGPLPEGAPEGCEEFRQQPDALERAAELDAQYGSKPPLDELPMYCIPMSFKDVVDTKDMRTTGGGDVNYANDVPPEDSTLVAQLRAKGAIIYGKDNLSEYNGGGGNPGGAATAAFNFLGAGSHSTWGGTVCNPYDTERSTGAGSSAGSNPTASANLAVCSICEQTGTSCQGPAGTGALVSIVTTKALISFGGAIGADPYLDRPGITCRSVEDAATVLDAIKDPEQGYFDSRDIYTALPRAFIPEQPYASFVIDDDDLKKNSKPLEGMRIGIVREYVQKVNQNNVDIADQLNNEFKNVLRDKLGAEIVESVDPQPGLYEDDPDIPNMEYTFQDAIAEILPLHMPEYLSKTTSSGDLEFAVSGWDVTTRDYMVAVAEGKAPLSDNLNMRRVLDTDTYFTNSFQMAQYLDRRGDDSVNDWTSLNDNSKFFSDARRAASENWENKLDMRSAALDERMKIRDVMRLVVLKVMHENDLDVLVNAERTTHFSTIGGAGVGAGGTLRYASIFGLPEIYVPAGFSQVVYDPHFALNGAKTNYNSVAGTEQTLLDSPGFPFNISFWAGPGEEPTLLKVGSAYEAATHHRVPPPDFGPLPGEP